MVLMLICDDCFTGMGGAHVVCARGVLSGVRRWGGMGVGRWWCVLPRRDENYGAIFTLILSLFFGGIVRGDGEEEGAVIKNVLFLISDDLKASVLGCYGDQVAETPNIDRLASKGWCLSGRIARGLRAGRRGSRSCSVDTRARGEVNLGQHFRENGWYSARVGKIYHMRVPGDIIAGTNGADVETRGRSVSIRRVWRRIRRGIMPV